MRVIEAPSHAHIRSNEVSVFLAGGITDCPDWQAEVIKMFDKNVGKLPVVMLNPRRANFPMSDRTAAQTQIEWEFDMITRADVIMFWFPSETLCPITLYELGFQMGQRFGKEGPIYKAQKLVVGCHPDYKRKQDVEVQTQLVDPRHFILTNLRATTSEAMHRVTDAFNKKHAGD